MTKTTVLNTAKQQASIKAKPRMAKKLEQMMMTMMIQTTMKPEIQSLLTRAPTVC